jgi:hypothetical protein
MRIGKKVPYIALAWLHVIQCGATLIWKVLRSNAPELPHPATG